MADFPPDFPLPGSVFRDNLLLCLYVVLSFFFFVATVCATGNSAMGSTAMQPICGDGTSSFLGIHHDLHAKNDWRLQILLWASKT